MFKRFIGGALSALILVSAAVPALATDTPVVSAPENLEVPAAATTYSSISIIWDKPEDYKAITGYNVYMDGVFKAKTAANETYYTAEELESDSQHTFTVKALVDETESAASNTVTGKTDVKGTVRDVTAAPYNAAGDGTTNDTAAIQAAIDACEDNDIVLIPENKTFLSGAIDLKSNMTLEVNGTLAGIQDTTCYEKAVNPEDTTVYAGGTTSTGSVYTDEAEKRLIWSRVEGWEQYSYKSLINIGTLTKGTDYGKTETYSMSNIKIIGTGEITGSNSDYKTNYTPISGQASYLAQQEGESAATFYDLDASNANDVTTNNIKSRIRGRLINVSNAQNVYMKGVTVSRPPMWTVHMIYSDKITTNGVTFKTDGYRNGDGWDPDSSSNCIAFGCDFKTGDDCVAVKSGKNPEGNKINRPAENIKIIGCTSNGGLGLAVGSEMSGGVEGVLVRDCELSNTRYGVELKANKVRGGYIRDFNVQDSTIDQVLIHSVTYNADGAAADTPPVFSEIHFKNTTIISRDGYNKTWLSTPIQIEGFTNDERTDDYYIKNVTFDDITVGTSDNVRQTISLKNCRNIAFNNVLQSNGALPRYTDTDATFTVDGEEYVVPEPTFEGIKGAINKDNNTYTWEIGKAVSAQAGTIYTDPDKNYVELTLGLGDGDTMNSDGINFNASSVKETTTSGQASVADTKRYLLVKPKYDGTMTAAIKFTSGTQTNNRIYYKDFADGSVDLSQCSKDTADGKMTGSDIGANTEKTMTLGMTADHSYVLYTYQNSSTIAELTYEGMTDLPDTHTVTFDYGADVKAERIVPDGGHVYDIPEPPVKDIIKLGEEHKNSGVLLKAVYNSYGGLVSVTTENDNAELTNVQTEYDLPDVKENEKYFLWSSFSEMEPLGVMDKKTAIWSYNGYKFTEDNIINTNMTITPSYELQDEEPAKTASITIKYVDEEKNKIKDDVTYDEEYRSGERYTVPSEYTEGLVVKTESGMYNHYNFNAGTSDIPAVYSENMTVTLVFNNDIQYDYYEDFESYTIDTSKWHKQNSSVPDPTIKTDNTKYINHETGNSTTGGYMTFDEVDTTGKKVHITADVKFTEPTQPTSGSKGNSQITICNTAPTFSGNNITWGINDTAAGHIIALEYNGGSTFKVNNVAADTDFIGGWVHMEADADFGSKEVSVTLTNAAGKSATYDSTIYSKTFDKNIGAFYMRSAGAEATTSIDNLTVRITGNGGEVVPDVESVINFKSVYAFGDSIVYGHNAPKQSFMQLISNDYAIDLNMMAKNGATIMPSSNRILTQINNAPAAEPDIVVFEGYTNDAYGSAESDPEFNPTGSQRDVTQCYGEVSAEGTTTFDENTFCGSFEKTISAIKTKWPGSKVVFVTIHKSGARNLEIQMKLRELSMQMCDKWGVEVVDMFTYENSAGNILDTTDSEQMAKYMIGGKGSHPNVTACNEFYIPAVVSKLESLYGG